MNTRPEIVKAVEAEFTLIRGATRGEGGGFFTREEAKEIRDEAKAEILRLIRKGDTESRIEALEALTVDLKAKIDSLEQTLAEAEKTPQSGTEGRMRSREEIQEKIAIAIDTKDQAYSEWLPLRATWNAGYAAALKWVLGED